LAEVWIHCLFISFMLADGVQKIINTTNKYSCYTNANDYAVTSHPITNNMISYNGLTAETVA